MGEEGTRTRSEPDGGAVGVGGIRQGEGNESDVMATIFSSCDVHNSDVLEEDPFPYISFPI